MRMIEDCRKGKIDMVITKSVSRFSRNNLDCLQYVRELKERGIPILFEKEGINTLQVSMRTTDNALQRSVTRLRANPSV